MNILKQSAISLCTLILIPVIGFSQQPLDHDRKVYIDQNSKTYWNKALPVYIRLSTAPDAETDYLLKSDTTPEYTEPFYFDTEGENFIRTRWAVDKKTGKAIYPKREVVWDVFADGIAPITNAVYEYNGKHVVDGKTYYSKNVSIQLEAIDNVSGVDETYYSLNGGQFEKYTGTITPNIEKEWTFSYYSVDKVGNSEADSDEWKNKQNKDNQVRFFVDDTPPVTQLIISDPKSGATLSPKTTLTLVGTDKGAGINKTYYRINDSEYRMYTGKVNLVGLQEGVYKLDYYSSDKVTNEEELQSYTFTLDLSAPVLHVKFVGDEYISNAKRTYLSGRTKAKITATDNQAGVNKLYFKFDESPYQEYIAQVDCDINQGNHTISFYGIDKIENKSKSKVRNFTIDTTPPVIAYSIDGPRYDRLDTVYVRNISSIVLNPYEKGYYQSGIKKSEYQISNDEETVYSDPFSIEKDGYNKLTLNVYDNVNNKTIDDLNFYVDNTPPEIFHHFSVDAIGYKTIMEDSLEIYPSHVMLYLAATDKAVGSKNIYYSINGAKEQRYVKPVEYFRSGSNLDVKVRALDYLGNESESTIRFSVEDYLTRNK